MKRTIALTMCALLALGASSVFAAPKTSDSKAIVGTWKASVGRYSDGTTEEDIDMILVFTATTMSDPMSESGAAHPYALDDKGKTIMVKDKDLSMRIAYKLDGERLLTIYELTVVKAGKSTSIIGTGETAMFASLDFAKR
jgi:hypothetical protein